MPYLYSSTYSLRGLFELLQQSVSQACRQKPGKTVCLVMDDVSLLLSVGVKLAEVVGLVHYCQQMITSSSGLCHVRVHNLLFLSLCKIISIVYLPVTSVEPISMKNYIKHSIITGARRYIITSPSSRSREVT